MIAVLVVLIATAFVIVVVGGAVLGRSSLIAAGVVGIGVAIGVLAIWAR